MAWIAPKTNWTAADGVAAADFNRIEGDNLHVYQTAIPLTGGTMTAALVLNADPVAALQAATKQYIDAQIAIAKTYAP